MLFDSNGTDSAGCNVFVQVQADRWLVRDAQNPGLSTVIRECADGDCAEHARRCFRVLVAANGRTITSERNCGGATGREKGIRPRGPSCSFQVNEITKFKPIFDGL